MKFDLSRLDEVVAHGKRAEALSKDEEGTLSYAWYINEDLSKIIIREDYASAEAFFAHLEAHAEDRPDFRSLFSEPEATFFGDVPDKLLAVMKNAGAAFRVFKQTRAF